MKTAPGDAPWLFFPNPGNGGDALIASGTLQEFRRQGIRWELGGANTPIRNRNVILGGGGNLVPMYTDIAGLLERCLREGAASVVLLPHTIRGHEELLGRLDGRFTLFAREAASYRQARRYAPGARVLTAHDMALHLDMAKILHPYIGSPADIVRAVFRRMKMDQTARESIRNLREAIAKLRSDNPTAKRFHLLRNDIESRREHRVDTSIDISEMLCFPGNIDPETVDFVSAAFLEAMASFEEVETDRLHGAIGAALLGKRVVMRDNSYGKNSDMYEFSLAARFPRIRFEHTISRDPV